MNDAHPKESGFSLTELMFVIGIFGLLLAFMIPSYRSYSQSQQLRGTSQNLIQTLQLQRSRAMATGQTVTINFNTAAPNSWTVMGNGRSQRVPLPKGVTYASANPTQLTLTRDGRVNTSGLVVLRNLAGSTDTVSVQISGMAMVR
jgi:prepilin-type N-terminal cleavage/methylation domain-containing protein